MFGITNWEDKRLKLDFEKTMEHIVTSIQTAGFDPYSQLYGYLKTGDATYITRTGDARQLIQKLDYRLLHKYVQTLTVNRHQEFSEGV